MTIKNGINQPSNDVTTLENGKALDLRRQIPSPHERMYCNGSLDKWRLFISHISERCDLSGLAKACTKYQLALTGFSDVDTHRERQTVTVDVPDGVNAALKDRYIRQGGSLRSIVLFAVHQMLRGFGNGSHTVTASISPDSEHGLSWEVSPTIVSHKNRGQTSVLEAISNIDTGDQRLQSSKNEENEEETQLKRASRSEEVGSELEEGWMKSELFDLPVIFVKARLGHVMRLSNIDVDFPLAVLVHEGHNDGGLKLAVQFSTALFAPETIQNFTDALKILLAEASTGPGTLVKDIDLLSAQQIQQLDVWNNTDGDYESSKRLNHLVEDAVRRQPDKVAVVCEGRELTYGDLNRQANCLARYLCRLAQPEQLIGLFLEKNELLIITILAIWKSGAAYVPIDPAFPDDRVRFVLDDTKANILIASDEHAARLQKIITSSKDIQVIRLELLLKELASSAAGEIHDGQNLDHLPLTSRQLAYVTYTSGTTGFPKGIFKEHTSVVNSITDLSVKYGVAGSHHETILLFSAYVFEPFVRQLLMALVNGHLLAIISDVKKYDSDYLLSLMQRHQVTYLNGTASVLQEYDFSKCPSLKRIILVGENLTAARYDSLRQRFKGTILNEYGFTESAFVTALNIFEPDSRRENTSLGRPVRNVKCYILNQELKRTPIGVTGELHIGGLGISRGYLNRPDLTPLKFIPNPFLTEREKELGINRLMYKTGDLARWLPNGEVEYLGRADFQIKLRGIRIEPGEIESTLSMYPNIRTSLVVSRKLRSGVIVRDIKTATIDTLTFTICYAGELFDTATILELLSMVQDTIRQISTNLTQPANSLEYLSFAQVNQLAEWNATEAEFPDATLHQQFELEVDRAPGKTAVVYEDVTLTYHELNERANWVAWQLKREVGIKPDDLVALVLDKSEHMIVSILAVWKSGGAYVPIDPSYPEERIAYILQDTNAVTVIADPIYIPKVEKLTRPGVPIYPSDLATHNTGDWSSDNPPSTSINTNLAYIFYTSGTTGRPKGVMVEHHGVVNLQASLSRIFGLRETDDEVIFSFSNYVFDHFVEQMTDALLNGQTLLVLNDTMRGDKERLYQYMEKNKVTYLSGTPSVISMYEFSRFKAHLRRIDCIGEAFSEPVFDQIRETFQGLIINGYGPTEVSITTHKRLYPFPERRTDKSIGCQIANSTSYVLDEDMKRVPIGAVGELYLGGDGVARGYHNRPDLTAERFPFNPFQTDKEKSEGRNMRLYKTGDLVRWIPGSRGEVEYLGRNDFQVKIRGVRIELGEVEAVLSSYPEIKQSVVIPRKRAQGGQTFLVGYCVSGSTISSIDIKRFMQSRLPDYMVPSRFIFVTKLPVTPSGKLDTKALPAADDSTDNEVVAPRTEIERTLREIWAELLEIPLEDISIYSDFFGLGGDSLKSTRLSFMVNEFLHRTISVAELFQHRTIEALGRLIVNGIGDIQDITLIDDTNKSIAVSPAQERILFLHELEGGNSKGYNITKILQLPSQISPSLIEQALRELLSRHEALRTLLQKDPASGTYHQKILNNNEAQSLFFINASTVRDLDHLDQKISDVSQCIFHLGEELPLRVYLFSESDVSLYLTLVIHHSNFDGWSWNIILRELVMLYSRLKGQDSIPLPKLKVQYKEFAHHHRHILTGDRFRVLSEFWRSKLENFEPLHLNTDKSRPPHFEYDGDDVNFIIGEREVKELQKMAKHCKASLYTVFLALYGLMLASYTHQTNIPVGVPVTHRTHPQFESVVGFFVNLLVVRVDVTQQGIVGLVKRVMRELVDAQLHQDMPFQEVTKLLNTENDPSRHPLVQTVFNYEPNQADTLRTKENKGGFAEYQPRQTYSAAKFDISATVSEMGSEVMVNFNYAISLFTKSTVMGMLETYRHLIHGVCGLTEHGINDTTQLPLTPTCQGDGSHLPLLETQLATPRDKEPAATLNKLFEAEVALASDCVAIVEGEKTITYGDLNVQANQLAWYLLSITDLKPDDHVALMLDKSISMLICILAVWKAGAAYVPLDPTFPDNRIGTILQESKPKAVLLHSKYAARFESQGISLITIDTTENISRQSTDDVKSNVQPENLAYSIFTSGTTGKPKGVSVKQNGVINLQNGLRMRYFGSCAPGSHSVLFLSNYIFDFSLEQIALSILSGQTLIIPPENSFASNEFYDICNSYKLSYLSGTPSLLQQIDLRKLKFLKMVTAAGEELHASQYKKMRDSFHGTIYNAYGITETTVYNLITAFSANDGFENCLREVLPGNRIYLLSHNLQPVPLNAVGQLYLAGDCLARGYLNQPTLTAQRFIPNPFRTDEDAASGKFSHLYKTGDLARCRLDSSGYPYIEYMGRNDLQIKLRGLRIELSEVQRVMSSVPGVEDCAVIAKYMDNNPHSRVAQYLVGYYSTENPSGLEEIIIRHMKTKLPGYMIPDHLCHLRGPFPVTRTGKLDIQKLPDINVTTGPRAVYSPPHNALQSKLCALWASVLGMERCGIDDDLFKMGGDSITSLHLVAQIHHRLSCKVTVRDLFEHRTIRKLYNNVIRNELSDPTSEFRTEQGLVTGEAPLLPIQEWFLSKPLEKRDRWNHTFYIQTPELDVDRLSVAVQKLQDYHDAFRIRLKQKGETFVLSFPTEHQKIALRILDTSSIREPAAVNEVLSEWQSGFNIEDGPIGIIGYLHGYSDKTARIWFSIHHLAIDTVSWQILIRDLRNLYRGEDLGSKGSSLRLWANSMGSYQGSKLEREYWDNLIVQSSESVAALPPSTGPRLKLGRVMSVDKSASLLQHAGRMEASVLAAVGLALQDVEPMCCNMVTLEGHGREEGIDSTLDVSRTMGWFTSMYPFQIPHVKEADMLAAVAEIKAEVDRVPCHGAGYGALYGYVRHPLPSVSVNYLGQLTRTSHIPDDDWNLAFGDGSYAYGLTCSPEDANKSSSAIDITVTCIDRRVAIDVSTDQLSGASTSSTESPSCQLFTEETFTPYFEYRDTRNQQGPTLFLLPPGEGGAESYFNNIVKYLPKHNLVAFNNLYLHSKALQTFEELAEWYTDHIRHLQPHGPYHLLGWSFGGILAIEIACRLDDGSGKAISSLLFIDTYFDVRGATEEIGIAERTILDKIHHVYDPEPTRLAHMLSRVKDVVLFKAAKPNDKYTSDEQRLLYEYYHRTRANNLDKFIPIERVSLMPLQGNTHFSWVRDVEQVKKACSVIENILDNIENGHTQMDLEP
ncbi:N-(5-amino-5-carboxypentanoyl)-L-cysteinyl-D-valine synthase [Trichophyton interdigitale]|nr:N-(5-amino-5-carboxypentanoyl)-L-cysteinyl-D-valine synthase [Trichophyton interdigitale]